MSEWLNILVSLSVAGSGVLVFACFITYVSKGRINAKWHYWNRKLSLLFFLIPIFLIPGLFRLFEKGNHIILFWNTLIVHQKTVLLTGAFIQFIFIMWLTGVIVTSLWFLYWYQHFNKRLKNNLVLVPKESITQHHLSKHMESMKLAENINIRFCKISMSPVLIGIFKPTIILPMYDISYDELNMIIKHELTHYKKKDLWIKTVMLLATILHWYNPLIHVLGKEVNKWCEFSCDEDVVLEMSHAERKKYGETILNMIQKSNKDLIPSFLGASFSTEKNNMKNRLIKIMEFKRRSKSIVILSVTVLLALGTVGMMSSALTHEGTPVVSGKMEQNDSESTTLNVSDGLDEMESEANLDLISIKKLDELKFQKEEWIKIRKQVKNNEIVFEDE